MSEPLTSRIRPLNLSDFVGQVHLVAPGKPLHQAIEKQHLFSFILWGPPGVGKTTLARIYAHALGADCYELSAVSAGKADVKKIIDTTSEQPKILFLDEIHRFNKAQQDSFLPLMEDGTLVLVGATTENPSFELNAAVLSRAQVLVLERLWDDELELLAQRAETEAGHVLPLDAGARNALLEMADGDGRSLLNLIEQILAWGLEVSIDQITLSQRLMRRAAVYDKSGDSHYNLISALHLSLIHI